jgi:3-deoxy-D-manno-octulosonic-acid transferase
MPVHVTGYLPWDVRAVMDALVGTLGPELVAFTKTEVWPGLTAAAAARGIPVVLIAATLPEGAGRLSAAGRALLRPAFRALDRVLAISAEDGERFLRMGVKEERIAVTGDPGVDSARQRAREANPNALYLAPFLEDRVPTLVAGSTWASDERELLPALAELRRRIDRFRVLVAPHEPRESHLRRLEEALRGAGFRPERLKEVEARGRVGDTDAIVVDRVGVLAHLYAVGDAAYVGGGFGHAGLHSVLEPAAAGIPVLFGPRHGRSRSAGELLGIGGAVRVADASAIVRSLEPWLRDRHRLEEAAGRASAYIEAHRGAARRTAESLGQLLDPSAERRRDGTEVPHGRDSGDHPHRAE